MLAVQAREEKEPSIDGHQLVDDIRVAVLDPQSQYTLVLLATSGISQELQDAGTFYISLSY